MLLYYIFYVYLLLLGSVCVAEKFQYISTEHPEVKYYNPKYISFANLTSQRYGRDDPFYYVGLHLHMLQKFGNNVSVDFYFYEWLTNVYKRGFVEMHFKFCDLIHKDQFFGSALKQGKLAAKNCPYPPVRRNLEIANENAWSHSPRPAPSSNFGDFTSLRDQRSRNEGEYHLYNMTIPVKYIPPHFPFRKGRIYANLTSTDANELMGYGYIDMEIKEFNIRRKKKN